MAWRSSKGRDSGSQPDALGVATRLAAGRLREGVALEPPLKSAGDGRRPRLPINDGELARDLPGPENGPEFEPVATVAGIPGGKKRVTSTEVTRFGACKQLSPTSARAG